MLTLPIPLLLSLLLGLLSLASLNTGMCLLKKAASQLSFRRRKVRSERPDTKETAATSSGKDQASTPIWWRHPQIRYPLLLGTLLLLFSFGGRYLVQLAFPAGQDEPKQLLGEPKTLVRTDGTRIDAEVFGPPNRPILVLTHGWGASSTEWYYAKKYLSDRYRLIVWDLPGLGESDQRSDRNFALEQMATDLHTVPSLAEGNQSCWWDTALAA